MTFGKLIEVSEVTSTEHSHRESPAVMTKYSMKPLLNLGEGLALSSMLC